ncbi:MAG: GGDEF domain-containing protein [Pseudomonadota bacterium]
MPAATDYSPRERSNGARALLVLLGDYPIQRRAIKRLYLLTHAYVLIWLLLGVSIWTGYSPVNVWFVVIYGVIGQAAFYAILRSGFSLALKDPLLCFPQALFGSGAVVLGYALIPFGQGAALQTLFVILVFDLHRLSSRQLAFVASMTVAMLAALVMTRWHLNPAGTDLRQEALNLSMAVLVVPLLAIVSGKVKQVHVRQMAQKAKLDQVLAELKTLSKRDAMTGAFNRRHMLELLDDEVKRQRRNQAPFSVAMLDIDHFKRVNDTHGHAVGDQVLTQLASMAGSLLRPTDSLARWGGEEFLVLMPVTPVAEAAALIGELRSQIEQHDWSQYAHGLQITFSSGVAEHALTAGVEQTIALADGALYLAKEMGRNRVEPA